MPDTVVGLFSVPFRGGVGASKTQGGRVHISLTTFPKNQRYLGSLARY